MIKDPFLKAVFNALEDEINRVNFEMASPNYTAKRQELESIMDTLEALPEMIETQAGPVEVRKLLKELDDAQKDLNAISFNVAIKRGFFTAFRFIFYCFTAEPGEWSTDEKR